MPTDACGQGRWPALALFRPEPVDLLRLAEQMLAQTGDAGARCAGVSERREPIR